MRAPVISNAAGFTYIGILFAVALAGIAMTLTAQVWRTNSQRAKEEQLLFAGGQIAQAIGRYYLQGPNGVRQFPRSLDDLLQDKRHPELRRYLRRVYVDPMTGKPDWGFVRVADGGITGVYSLSGDKPVRAAASFNGMILAGGKYSDWRFSYDSGSGAGIAPPGLAETQSASTSSVGTTQAQTPGAASGGGAVTPASGGSGRCNMVILPGNMLYCQEQ